MHLIPPPPQMTGRNLNSRYWWVGRYEGAERKAIIHGDRVPSPRTSPRAKLDPFHWLSRRSKGGADSQLLRGLYKQSATSGAS